MKLASTRRGFLALAGAGAAVALAGCGSGSVVSAIQPKHFYVVGDGFSDVGQTGAVATVNDGSLTWIQQLAARYGLTVTPAASGGTGYAQAFARIDSADTTSGLASPSVAQQIDQLLADVTFENDDVVFVNGGMSDIVAAVTATGLSDATTAAVKAHGVALADQVRRLVNAGAKHVVVTGVYNLSISPWSRSQGLSAPEGIDEGGPMTRLSDTFNNDGLKVSIAGLGDTVLYFDAAVFYNFIASKPGNFSVDNATTPVCTTPTALSCTTGTVKSPDYNRYLFADDLHFTPEAQRKFVSDNYAENVYTKLKGRW
ncbi:SGNH/GDSL hydrolase family protein [Ottowia sp.]|jgi:phospholipase/lecithinase/hemolysin|uniref:SGNH/GDSL hydrolase family protein n=1 Tax=Ottowia sp. TaxID=1898956 RepID=UPI0025E2567F|nr:SGNH/GDSL hydrolase family protein [Ottowia sp.]MBK6614965.1 SGNH/GDSL hydrolase family protein [Ottowia sp.]